MDKPRVGDRRLHPAIRLLLLLAVAAGLPTMSLPALTVLAVLFLAAYRLHAGDALRRLVRGLSHLRWLLLAIFVLYGAFTPGTPLLAQLPGLSVEGLGEGARRALILVNLLILVYWLLAVTPTAELLLAIELLLRPLRPLGLDARRVGLRLALALETVEGLRARTRAPAAPGAGLLDRAAAVVGEIEAAAADPAAAPVDLPEQRWPRWWEWALPLIVLLVLQYWTP